ncbi:phosphopyruvate hydratase [Candidatus Bathyarchaeota archaeon]|nr:phosphopyruvate hydratase [Candidatus Bathyarchaeota archaeon]NIU81259.1 phosphopyruvate hydratase [Candidatus Bathyarchaeota archaeon]NIV68422.1 phosphopyruvate hydratase [Candidatus Bathyarchaeota archaeon]NIW16721.1 phosphopyruvate hydratase [Candidatus Bathyarchaeota archaeon]NIW34921.1 phosphopyruvate hydratase [Candidatus Bathyarchaeota archaeon]
MSTVIEDVTARKIYNSRGEETIEVDIITVAGFGRASAPAGASRGAAEVVSYPPGRVDQAIDKVADQITPELVGRNADEQEEIDTLLHEIDETRDFSNLGGNTAYAVSLATAEAAATSYGLPLFEFLAGYLVNEFPHPLGNVLGGGKHASGKAPDIQEFLILPVEVNSFYEASRANTLVHSKVGSLVQKADETFTGGRGDEGAWAPNLKSEEALELMLEACEAVSEDSGVECRVGLDVAASSLWNSEEKCYLYPRDGVKRSSEEQLEFLLGLVEDYHLAYVEDPFHEEDFEGFAEFTRESGRCLVCGDDLFTTDTKRLTRGIKIGAGNSVIIKANQVGTLTDAWKATQMAQKAGYTPVMSHRSGETTDTHIAHLTIAFRCPIIKTGIVGGSRISKINELTRIEETIGERAKMTNLQL